MASDRRRDAATATVGAAAVAGGGVMRHRAVERSVSRTLSGKAIYPRFHAQAPLGFGGDRRAKALYAGGAALGLVGTAPLAVGAHGLATSGKKRRVTAAKADFPPSKRRKSFLREGLEGSSEALHDRSESALSPVPAKVRGVQLGAAASAGWAGSAAAAKTVQRYGGKKFKPGLAPLAGVLAATATLPVSNKLVQRTDSGYEVTASGVKRVKRAPKRPSSVASVVDTRAGRGGPNTRSAIVPTDVRKVDIPGRPHVSNFSEQRLRGGKDDNNFINGRRPRRLPPEPGSRFKYGASKDTHAPRVPGRSSQLFDGENTVSNRSGSHIALNITSSKARDDIGRQSGTYMNTTFPRKGQDPQKWADHAQRSSERSMRAQGYAEHGLPDIRPELLREHARYEGLHGEALQMNAARRAPAAVRRGLSARGKVGVGLTLSAAGVGAAVYAGRHRRGKQGVRKFEPRTTYAQQRGIVTAAGATPGIGPVAGGLAAARYAPPGQERKHAARQALIGPAAGWTAGAAGAYGGASLAANNKNAAKIAQGTVDLKSDVTAWGRKKLGMGAPKAPDPNKIVGRTLGAIRRAKIAQPLVKSPTRMAGAAAGLLGAKFIGGTAGGQASISLNQRDQKRWKQGVHKLDDPAGSKRQQHRAAKQKQLNAAVATGTGLGSIASLGMLAAKKKDMALKTGIVLGAVGGANSVLYGRVARREAKVADPYHPLKKRLEVVRDRKGSQTKTEWRSNPRPSWGLNPGAERDEWKAEDKRLQATFTAQDRREREDALRFTTELRAAGLRMRPAPKTTVKPLRTSKTLARVKAMDVESRERYFQTKTGRGWMARNGLGRAGTLSWGPADGKTNAQWRARSGFGQTRKQPSKGYRGTGRAYADVGKKDSLLTGMNRKEQQELVGRYGDRGPLPKTIDRNERMRAYEARYSHHGGDKSEKWNRRANAAEGARNVSLATGTAALGTMAAMRHPKLRKIKTKHPKAFGRWDTTALAAGAAGGGSELYGEYARARRSSASNSPGGVAASALRRMRANTPTQEAS